MKTDHDMDKSKNRAIHHTSSIPGRGAMQERETLFSSSMTNPSASNSLECRGDMQRKTDMSSREKMKKTSDIWPVATISGYSMGTRV